MNGRKRVLVLDFDHDLLIVLQRTLEKSGFSTITTWDMEEGIDLLATRYFDFFVVGNRPPELNARHIVHDVRSRGIK